MNTDKPLPPTPPRTASTENSAASPEAVEEEENRNLTGVSINANVLRLSASWGPTPASSPSPKPPSVNAMSTLLEVGNAADATMPQSEFLENLGGEERGLSTLEVSPIRSSNTLEVSPLTDGLILLDEIVAGAPEAAPVHGLYPMERHIDIAITTANTSEVIEEPNTKEGSLLIAELESKVPKEREHMSVAYQAARIALTGDLSKPTQVQRRRPYTQIAESFRKQKNFVIWLLIGLMIILALIIAVPLGFKLGKKSSTPSPVPIPTRTSSPQPTEESVGFKKGSSLAVIGWYEGSESYSLRLFYQDEENYVRMLSYDSWTGNWSMKPENVLRALGVNYTPIAVTGWYNQRKTRSVFCEFGGGICIDGGKSQITFIFDIYAYFVMDNGCLGEIRTSSLNTMERDYSGAFGKCNTPGPGVQLTAGMDPLHVRIVADGVVEVAEYDQKTEAWSSRGVRENMNFTGSMLLELPTIAPDGKINASIFLRNASDGNIIEYYKNGSNYTRSGRSPGKISESSSLAGFTVRSSSAKDAELVSYLLYQSSNGTVYSTYRSGGSEWGAPTAPAAFADADERTGITCNSPMRLTRDGKRDHADDFMWAKCYFMLREGRSIREVGLKDGTWMVTATITQKNEG